MDNEKVQEMLAEAAEIPRIVSSERDLELGKFVLEWRGETLTVEGNLEEILKKGRYRNLRKAIDKKCEDDTATSS